MPEIARSKEPYPLDKLALIDTDRLLKVVTYPPEWYLKNVLSATDKAVEEAVGWLRGEELGMEVERLDVTGGGQGLTGMTMATTTTTTTTGTGTVNKEMAMERRLKTRGVQAELEAAAAAVEEEEAAAAAETPTQPTAQVAAAVARLESLPYELFLYICERCTIAALWTLKNSSRRLAALVASLKEVQLVAAHAPGALAVLLRTGAARFWTLGMLRRLMITNESNASASKTLHLCEGCQPSGTNPGPWVLLLTGQRKCWPCLTRHSMFSGVGLDISQTRAVGNGGLEGIWEEEVEAMDDADEREGKGDYRRRKITIKAGPDDPFLRLPHPVDLEFEYTSTTKGKREAGTTTSKGQVTILLPPAFTSETLAKVTDATLVGQRPNGVSEDEFRAHALFRYTAMPLPYFLSSLTSSSSSSLETPSHICWGCLLASRVTDYPADPEVANSVGAWSELRIGMVNYRKLVYSREEYLQHFRWCRLAQERWEAAVKNRDLRTGEEVVPEEYRTEPLEDIDSNEW